MCRQPRDQSRGVACFEQSKERVGSHKEGALKPTHQRETAVQRRKRLHLCPQKPLMPGEDKSLRLAVAYLKDVNAVDCHDLDHDQSLSPLTTFTRTGQSCPIHLDSLLRRSPCLHAFFRTHAGKHARSRADAHHHEAINALFF